MTSIHPMLVVTHFNDYFNQGEVKDLVDINGIEISFDFRYNKLAKAVGVMLAHKFHEVTAKNKPQDFQDGLTDWSKNTPYWVRWLNYDKEKHSGTLEVTTRRTVVYLSLKHTETEYRLTAYSALLGDSDTLDEKESKMKKMTYQQALQQYRKYKFQTRKDSGSEHVFIGEGAKDLFKKGIALYYNQRVDKSSGFFGVCYKKDSLATYFHNRLVELTEATGVYHQLASNGVSGVQALDDLKTNQQYIESIDTVLATSEGDTSLYFVTSKKLGVRFKVNIKENKKTGSSSFYLLDMLFL